MVSEAEVTPEMQHLTTSHSKGELVSKEVHLSSIQIIRHFSFGFVLFAWSCIIFSLLTSLISRIKHLLRFFEQRPKLSNRFAALRPQPLLRGISIHSGKSAGKCERETILYLPCSVEGKKFHHTEVGCC